MKKTTLLFLLFLLIGLTSCNKIGACVKKTDTELEDLDESQMTYFTYSHNGDNIKVPHYLTANYDLKNDLFFVLFNDSACSEINSMPISTTNFEVSIRNKCKELFIASDPCFAWDGVDKNGNPPKRKGKYRFTLNVEWTDGTQETFENYVELIK